MYVETKRGRVYCMCDKCGKPYSFKTGSGYTAMMQAYCREHGQLHYPPLPKHKARA